MPNYFQVFIDGYAGYASYLWYEITHPGLKNYFYWLIVISLFFFILERVKPWRKHQPKFRKDFWLDAFYMFFNFFLFSLIIYNAATDVIVNFLNWHVDNIFGIDLKAINPLYQWPMWSILLVGLVVRDFVQWWTHRLLHRVPRLWEFHKVHHSVEQMGFAAHLRYHWMETVVYRTIEYLPLALLGIGLYDFFIIHIFTLAVGHYNHSNITINGRVTGAVIGGMIGVVIALGLFDTNLIAPDQIYSQLLAIFGSILAGAMILGPIMKIIFNSPEMHIWHHAHEWPQDQKHGINFGLTLAVWDYLFGTAYIPYDGKNIRLGFPNIQTFPDKFISQVLHGFKQIKE